MKHKPTFLPFFSFLTFFSFLSLSATAQIRPLNIAVWPESDKDTTHYTVKGYRHGTSVFRQVKHKEVEYSAGETLTRDRYHTVDVVYTWMKRWAEKYPDLVDLYEVGFSYEGRPILQVTLANKKTGKDTDKPAAFFEGGRLMKRVHKGKGLWTSASEGWDNDGDGKINEDGIGGLDLHRNYPENWRPEDRLDVTGRGWTQNGAGEFPLSESETRALFNFLMTHPNVSVVNSMDTQVPMHLRGPSTEFSAKGMYEADRKLLEYYDTLGMKITGYPWAGDVYDEYNTKEPVNDYSGDSTKAEPLFGHGPDFGYSYFGAIWYGDEIWNGGLYADLNKDGKKDELDILLWDDQENGGRGFKEWTSVMHPFLGPVENGGYHPKFFSQNPPPEHLEPWIRKQAMFNLAMAEDLPTLEWNKFKVKELKDYKDSTDYQVTVSWKNTARIPTALNIAQRVKIVQLDQAVLDFDKKLMEGDQPKIKIVDPKTTDKTRYADHLWQNQEATATFTIRSYGKNTIKGKVKVLSTRGGVLEKEITLE